MLSFAECFRLRDKEMLSRLLRELRAMGGFTNIKCTKKFLFAEGNIPVMLVAHLDTVHHVMPIDLYFDKNQGVYWSPQGLGADDRAGVWGILSILKKGYRPSILFTMEEETGGHGAKSAVAKLTTIPYLKYIIELDRRGKDDCVFYDCDNPEFVEYVESFGFKEDFGTFSDISHICPAWGIAGVNLSTGYYSEHTKQEILKIHELETTVSRVIKMLEDINSLPVPFIFIEGKWWRKYSTISYGTSLLEKGFICDYCATYFDNDKESPEVGCCIKCYDEFNGYTYKTNKKEEKGE